MYQTLREIFQRSRQTLALNRYGELYEQHAKSFEGPEVVGCGDFELIGRMELRLLELAGLHEEMAVLDFGCGIGRLADHLLPLLKFGRYLGVDISPTMILRGEQRLRQKGLMKDEGRPQVELQVGDGGILNTIEPETFDLACAFSVFTHMDLEDTFLHLQCIKRVLKPGATLVCSHLLLPESESARNIFVQSSAQPYEMRRSQVLSVVSCREMINTVAEMAGYRVNQWIAGDEQLYARDQSLLGALGQAVSFLQVPQQLA